MRITENTTYRTMQTNLDRIDNKLLDLRTQGTTQRKLNKPSDDPSVIGAVLNTRNQIQQNDQFIDTLNSAGDAFAAADTQMASLENLMVRGKEIAIAAASGGVSDADRATYANEIDELIDQMVSVGNTRISGNYIFSGYSIDTPPFVKNESYDSATFDENAPGTWPVHYQGDNHSINIEIAPDEMMKTNVTGNELFMGVSNESFDSDPNIPTDSGKNLFNTFIKLQKSILQNDTDSLTDALQEIDIAAEQNRNIRADQGVRANNAETSLHNLDAAQTDLTKILSRYQDADAIEVYSDIIKQEGAFRAALQITGRISQISILDYL